jgi:hypothetical protein
VDTTQSPEAGGHVRVLPGSGTPDLCGEPTRRGGNDAYGERAFSKADECRWWRTSLLYHNTHDQPPSRTRDLSSNKRGRSPPGGPTHINARRSSRPRQPPKDFWTQSPSSPAIPVAHGEVGGAP